MQVLEKHRGKGSRARQADQIDASNLVRVYGALLWNVGKVRGRMQCTMCMKC